jgi:hypothetical protein
MVVESPARFTAEAGWRQVADSLFVLGHRIVKVGILAPDLGAALAATAAAQLVLGHARFLYQLLADRPESAADLPVAELGQHPLPKLNEEGSWVTLVAKWWRVELALDVLLRLCPPGGTAFHGEKLQAEVAELVDLTTEWAQLLRQDAAGVRERLEAGVREMDEVLAAWLPQWGEAAWAAFREAATR